MTIVEAAERYNVRAEKIRYRLSVLQDNPTDLNNLIDAGVLKESGGRWIVTSDLMDTWFGEKEKTAHIFPQKVKEYISTTTDLDEILKLKALIEQQEVKVKSSDDYIARLAHNLKIPYYAATGFKQLAAVLDVTIDELEIKNWNKKRLYYRDPRRSKSSHRAGEFYYCLERKRFVNPYLDEEDRFGLEDN